MAIKNVPKNIEKDVKEDLKDVETDVKQEAKKVEEQVQHLGDDPVPSATSATWAGRLTGARYH